MAHRPKRARPRIPRVAQVVAVATALAFAPPPATGEAPPGADGADETELRERAAALHRDALVVDGHNDVGTLVLDFGFDLGMDGAEPEDHSAWPWFFLPWLPARPAGEALRTHTDLERARAGGLDAQFFSVWASDAYYDPAEPTLATERALAMLTALEAQFARHGDRMELATTAADVRRIAGEGRLAALLGLEGGHAIGHSLEALRLFARRGVRYMTLTWSFSHTWADASGDPWRDPEVRHGGLSDFGREVVREMNRLGMLVDVSHVSDDTFRDALAVSRAPVVASHSSARALAEHPRNLSDEMLRAVAANGGVVMINFHVQYLDPRKTTNTRLAWDWVTTAGGSDTTLAQVADHVDHVVQVAGVDHVGLGSDFDGTPFLPTGLGGVEDLPRLTEELLRRGYGEEAIRKILGENVLRALAEAERVANESPPPR